MNSMIAEEIKKIENHSELSPEFKSKWLGLIAKISDDKTPVHARESLLDEALQCCQRQLEVEKNIQELKLQVEALKQIFGLMAEEIKKTHQVVLQALAQHAMLEMKTRQNVANGDEEEIVYH